MSSLSFSYAQAAKGLAPSSNVSSNPVSSASSEHGAKESNVTAAIAEPPAAQSREKEFAPQTKAPPASSIQNEGDSAPIQDKSSIRHAESIADDSKSMHSQPSSNDDFVAPPKAATGPSAAATHTAEEHDTSESTPPDATDTQDKTKEADDDWEKVSLPSSTADKELKAAPIPAVNIWHQRLGAQQAKSKDQPVQRPAASTSPQVKPQTTQASGDDSRKKVNTRETITSDTTRTSPGRTHPTARPPRDQRGNSASPRSTSQQKDQPTTQVPPPVDAASWPTPERAIVDTGRRSSILDKGEKADLADTKPSSRKEKWTTLPFVPSVKFETQLPSSRRGGRTGTTRGGGRGQGDRNSERPEPGSMGPPALPKQGADQDRGRKSNNSRSNRASSVPTETPRAEAAGDRQHAAESRLVRDSTTMDSQSQSLVTNDNPLGAEASTSKAKSRSSSRPAPTGTATASRPKPDVEHVATQNPEVIDSPTKQSHRSDKHSNSATDNARSTVEGNDRTPKEWTKERSNKSDTWRSEQRGERSERGRGAYRGRGNRAGYTNPSFTTPIPQNGFDVSKHNSVSDTKPSRQSSQSFGAPAFGSSRTNTRAQSIPLNSIQGAFFSPPQGYPPALAPLQTDMSYAAYGQVPNGVPGGIMSAIPYNEPLNGYALISMVSKQLEYYFSLDNLCKDMFLRKNMDSQGFVLLRVIADFRRIKTLLGEGSMSYEHLRGVAAHVPNTEFVTGEDGEDRVRSRGKWRDFVLPVGERVLQAQNEGPQIQSRQPVNMPPEFHLANGLRSAPPNTNGFQDAFTHHHTPVHFSQGLVTEPQNTDQWSGAMETPQLEDRRASVASPVGKVQSPGQESKSLYGSMSNGHRDSSSSNPPGKENTFPDESIALLKVVVKDSEYHAQDGSAMTEESAPNRSSGLRGGAGSPEQFERIRSLQFGQNPIPHKKSSEQTMYFTQGEGPRPELMKPGYIHEDYVTLRDQAYNQRAENHFGGALLVLYPLWADFLAVPHQFNAGMYEEFKTWALEDEKHGNDNGKKHLAKFYDTMLGLNSPMTERVSNDIITIARAESGNNRQTWLRLRGAWRNGATNLKTRKRLAELLTAEEREELDRNT